MTTGLIRRTLKKFGAQPYLLTIASELEWESKEMEDVYCGGGDEVVKPLTCHVYEVGHLW